MNNDVIKTAKRFLKYDLHGKVGIERISEYIKGEGYPVVFYGTDEGDKFVELLGVGEYAKGVRAFTFKRQTAKYVFVKSSLPHDEKRYSLLHEAAHIALGHLEVPQVAADRRLQDLEAEAFTYGVLSAMCKKRRRYLLNALCSAVVSFVHSFKKDFSGYCIPYLLTDERPCTGK